MWKLHWQMCDWQMYLSRQPFWCEFFYQKGPEKMNNFLTKKAPFWQVFNDEEFPLNTCNKTDCIAQKSMKTWASIYRLFIWTILLEVTWAFWRMCIWLTKRHFRWLNYTSINIQQNESTRNSSQPLSPAAPKLWVVIAPENRFRKKSF